LALSFRIPQEHQRWVGSGELRFALMELVRTF